MKKYLLLIALFFCFVPSQAADPSAKDMANRLAIKSFVDSMPGYFEKKDMQSISAIFSDDILIVTDGQLIRKQSDCALLPRSGKKIDPRDRAILLDYLSRWFKQSWQVSVVSKLYSITRSGSHPAIYGATVHLTVEASSYKDEGWMFFVWDFTDPERPQIMTRTWQPDIIGDSQIITLSDFYTPTRSSKIPLP